MVDEHSSETKAVFKADLASWRALSALSLEVTAQKILVWTRPAFMRRPVLKAEFDSSAVDSFKIEDDRQMTVTLFFDRSEEYFEFRRPEDALRMCDALREVLGPLDEVSRSKKRRDEEERLRIEQDKQRIARAQSYASRIWDIADIYRLLAAGAYRVVQVLSTEGWKEAHDEYTSMWQRTQELDDQTGSSLLPLLEEVGRALSNSDGPQAVKRMASFVDAMTKSSMEDAPSWPDWQGPELRDAARPGWYDLRYFVLFSCLLQEMELACVLADWAQIGTALDGLVKLTPAIESLFGIALSENAACLGESVSRKDVIAAEQCAQSLSVYLGASVRRNRSLEVGLNNGPLSEPS
jgi:hypothetical protein